MFLNLSLDEAAVVASFWGAVDLGSNRLMDHVFRFVSAREAATLVLELRFASVDPA